MFMIVPHNAANGSAIHPLLLVPLDDGGRAHLGLIRILAELAPRVPLPQQIPTLIEFDLDGFQPYLIVIGQCALPVEMLLLVNKTVDLLQDGVIGRRFSHINHLADSSLSGSPGRCRVRWSYTPCLPIIFALVTISSEDVVNHLRDR